MNEEQITAIAREYAEFAGYGSNIDALVGIENGFGWLSQRYCLVEKEAVRKEYDLAEKLWMKSACTLTEEFNRGRMNAIESLFPEIAKEVEE